jgi:hypothetical protein
VSVSFMGSSVRFATVNDVVTTDAPRRRKSRRGRIPGRGLGGPGAGTVALCSQRNASPLRIILC